MTQKFLKHARQAKALSGVSAWIKAAVVGIVSALHGFYGWKRDLDRSPVESNWVSRAGWHAVAGALLSLVSSCAPWRGHLSCWPHGVWLGLL